VIRVGTYKAAHLFADSFQLGRRGLGQGDFVWDRMEKGSEAWTSFWPALWHYQYTRVAVPWDEHFDAVFFHETQGITDLAVKLFAVAQTRAMELGSERLTPEFVAKVAAHDFRTVQPALDALRSGSTSALARYEDLLPPATDLEHLLTQGLALLDRAAVANLSTAQRSAGGGPPAATSAAPETKPAPKRTKAGSGGARSPAAARARLEARGANPGLNTGLPTILGASE
jgi:hypothetical protein